MKGGILVKAHQAPEKELLFPEHQTYSSTVTVRIIGLILRCLTVAFSVFSVSLFISEALSAKLPLAAVIAVSLISSAVGITMSRSRYICLGGIAIFASIISGFLLFIRDSFYIVENAFYSVANVWQARLFACEYVTEEALYDLSDFLSEKGISERGLFFTSFIIITAAFGVTLAALTAKKVRTLPTLILISVPTVFLLYFGMCENRLSLALTLSAASALAALACYDNLYTSKKNIQKPIKFPKEIAYTAKINSYFGGYIAVAAGLLALVISLPVTRISYAMPDIPQISKPVKKAESFISSTVNTGWYGSSAFFFTGSIPEEERSTQAENRIYSGKKIFKIHTETDIPVYLRMWTGTDYYGDGWHTVSLDRISLYREKFGIGFTPEFLTAELLRAVDPELVALRPEEKSRPHISLGYITAPVYISEKSLSSSLVAMPSYSDQPLGFLKYGTREADTAAYSNYYDGIFSSSYYMFMDEYGFLANLPYRDDSNFADNLSNFINYYALQTEPIKKARYMRVGGYSPSEIRSVCAPADTDFAPFSDGYILPEGEDSLSYRYVFLMNEDERRQVDAVLDNFEMYEEYVYENYLSPCEGFDAFAVLMGEITENSGIADRGDPVKLRHEMVMAVINYLSDNMTYTLTPKSPSPDREYINAAETFLFDTKEGYCVQYATAAVMLLRSAGIPARYAEGYAAKEFTAASSSAPGAYTATVRDGDAHAWVEVFYENFGWVQYEVTFTGNGDEPSQLPDSDTSPDTSSDIDGTDEAVPPDSTENTNDTSRSPDKTSDSDSSHGNVPPSTGKKSPGMIPFIATIFISAAFAAILIIAVRRHIMSVNERYERFSHSESGNESEIGREVGERILRLLRCRGITPFAGERWEDFALRADKTYVGISEALILIRKCEFARDISASELDLLIRCLGRLLEDFKSEKGSLRYVLIKYFAVR